MAKFCNKCGAPLGGIFCVKCGADSRLAASPQPQPTPAQPAMSQASTPQAPTTPTPTPQLPTLQTLTPEPPPTEPVTLEPAMSQVSPAAPVPVPLPPPVSMSANPPVAKFCNKCGAPSIGAPFCNNCGASMREAASPAPQPAASRPAKAAASPSLPVPSQPMPAPQAYQGQPAHQNSRRIRCGRYHRRRARCRRRVLRRIPGEAESSRSRARCSRPGLQFGQQFQFQRRDHGFHFEDGFRIRQQRRRSSGGSAPTAASAEIPAAS